MTSSICSFMNSFLRFWLELTNCKYIWLLFLPDALHPLGNMPVPTMGYQTSLSVVQCKVLSAINMGEGDKKRMREARRISTCPLTQKDLFS